MKDVVRWFLVIVIGIGITIGGVVGMNETGVKCGSRTTEPGDQCTTTRKGHSATRTY
jgi:hypothetical protein